MKNYRDLSIDELRQLEQMYPTTPNRELRKKFGITANGLYKLSNTYGWKKSINSVHMASKVVLTEEQIQWIITHYENTSNLEIVNKFGIGEAALRRIAKQHGLTKSKQFLRKIQLDAIVTSRRVCMSHGIYAENTERLQSAIQEKIAKGERVGFEKGVNNRSFSANTAS